MGRYKLEVLLIFVPLIYGYIASRNLIFIHPFAFQLIFGVFWLWVGMKFGRLAISKFKSILLGNSIWLLSFLIFIWQFVILDDLSRNIAFTSFSQYYMLPFIWSGSKLVLIFSDTIHSSTVMILSYICMLLTFIVGFLIGCRKG
ncbi:hypothetical protein DS745_03475 [Anaerobacillus alkaliphilus]|uniref:Uncharacterized protein n=1 Tax=Anaerobacillus alkaliphilus TaxID=1548597 RepID=A0A4Q0VXJ1_9BACI|nr:hypothetical protein [Anaerobacillus alkaliphilus]RXJ04457.1 hypothetical protein DS745_03475 [Anaerobacillus alkaliphilus]